MHHPTPIAITDHVRSAPHRRLAGVAALLGVGLALAACGVDEESEPSYGTIESAVSVGTYATSGCSTSVVVGLSTQIADEIGCMNPGSLVKFSPSAKIVFSSNAVMPYLPTSGKAAVERVAQTRTVQINSAFRTVAQQYLLYRWFKAGRCGIRAAATPGRSNHESGRALDLQNYSAARPTMQNQGWKWFGAGDPVHFDHLSSPDIRGRDVKAFQRLWNRNNPTDKIAEDGAYGPQTEARLRAAPATGFAKGPTCGTRAFGGGAQVVMIDGPDKVAPGARASYTFTVVNNGVATWPAHTRIAIAAGAASPLFDAASWTSPSELGTLGSDVASGAQGILSFDIVAPQVLDETPFTADLVLLDGGQTLGTVHVALTVTPNGDEGTSADADDEHDHDETEEILVTGGCAAGGHGNWAALLVPVLIVLRRRRR